MTSAAVMPSSVTVRVPAKVNLELLVGAPREDGYHPLATVYHAVSLYDEVTVAVNGLRIDGAQRRVWAGDAEVHLTPTEFDLLACLAARPGTVLSREALLAEVWGWADASGTRTVDSHVKSLRRKLGADRVRTVHGVGYALEPGA